MKIPSYEIRFEEPQGIFSFSMGSFSHSWEYLFYKYKQESCTVYQLFKSILLLIYYIQQYCYSTVSGYFMTLENRFQVMFGLADFFSKKKNCPHLVIDSLSFQPLIHILPCSNLILTCAYDGSVQLFRILVWVLVTYDQLRTVGRSNCY